MKRQRNNLKKLAFVLVAGMFNSCSDFIEVGNPKTEIVTDAIFVSDVSALSALRGIYSLMMTNNSFTRGGIEEFTGIYSDELISHASRADQLQFFQNALTVRNTDVLGAFWREPFRYINNANAILEGLQQTNGVSEPVRKQLEGEARFIRAFCYFYLVNLFGDVPYLSTSDYRITSIAARNSVEQVNFQIEADLLVARDLLADDFTGSNNERNQPNRGAATALLARHYLYTGQWTQAEAMATQVIDQASTYSLVSDLAKVFLANSTETIWQLKPVVPNANAPQAPLFVLTLAPNPTSRRLSLRPGFAAIYDVEDKRRSAWIGTFTNTNGSWDYSHKYKVVSNATVTEYNMVLRLAEQYLIRAEARAHLNNLDGANADVNVIRQRAGLTAQNNPDVSSMLAAIELERQKELFTEWGHRWLDLKRTNRASAILTPLKTDWQETDLLFPIPDAERVINTNLSQNPGY